MFCRWFRRNLLIYGWRSRNKRQLSKLKGSHMELPTHQVTCQVVSKYFTLQTKIGVSTIILQTRCLFHPSQTGFKHGFAVFCPLGKIHKKKQVDKKNAMYLKPYSWYSKPSQPHGPCIGKTQSCPRPRLRFLSASVAIQSLPTNHWGRSLFQETLVLTEEKIVNQKWPKKTEFWFFFLHILNGRMATLPQALPRSFRDLHFCFRESKFKTAASASFRGVDFFRIFLEVLPRSHGELPRKLYLGVAWKCVICILGWVNVGEPFFMILSSIQMGSGSFSASAWKVCFRKASAKLPQRIWTHLPKNILRPLPACVYHGSCN